MMLKTLALETLAALAFLAVTNVCECKVNNYDNFDVESVLSNTDRLKRFFLCLRDDHTCNTEDRNIKNDFQEMISTQCASCTNAEKEKLELIRKRAVSDPAVMALAKNPDLSPPPSP